MQPLQMSQTVMNDYAARILLATFERSASAIELSRRFGIPIAACYRRINELEALGLVYCEHELPSRNGRGLQLFRSRLKSVRIALEDGRLHARVEVGPAGIAMAAENQVQEQIVNLREPSSIA
ncbi:MAG TPA: winged helix-turn-helix transcriptional regulator [Thermoplasmata archaeon]|nr:winged helix-turn-helix transcriptional regulator [Thermoplasmata archaeon]